MNYIDLLNDSRVKDRYDIIDSTNPFPFSHGTKHVTNVCRIIDRICNLIGINEEEKEALLIAGALHDLGQVEGRKEHGRNAMIYIMNNLSDEIKDNKYYDDILKAIEVHSDGNASDEKLFYLILFFSDKMDFDKNRLVDNYKDKFGYRCFEDFDKIEFIYDDEYFGIDINTSNIDNFEEAFFKEEWLMKPMKAIKLMANKLDRKPILMNNGRKIEGIFDEKQFSHHTW